VASYCIALLATALWKELELRTHFILKLLCNYVPILASYQWQWHPRNEMTKQLS